MGPKITPLGLKNQKFVVEPKPFEVSVPLISDVPPPVTLLITLVIELDSEVNAPDPQVPVRQVKEAMSALRLGAVDPKLN